MESCEDAMNQELKRALSFQVDGLATPIGTMMIAGDEQGKLRVALFTEDEEAIRGYLRRQA
ncbi:MAG: hypothetical protein ACXV5R_11965, partial [Candidatus Angelobacter sp.]